MSNNNPKMGITRYMFEDENYQAGFMMHKASESPLAVVVRTIQQERKEIEELKQKLFEMRMGKIK